MKLHKQYLQGAIPMDIPCQVSEASAMATSQMDIVVQRLVSYLSKTQQVSNKQWF